MVSSIMRVAAPLRLRVYVRFMRLGNWRLSVFSVRIIGCFLIMWTVTMCTLLTRGGVTLS